MEEELLKAKKLESIGILAGGIVMTSIICLRSLLEIFSWRNSRLSCPIIYSKNWQRQKRRASGQRH